MNLAAESFFQSALQCWSNPEFDTHSTKELMYPVTDLTEFEPAANAHWNSVREAKMIMPELTHGSYATKIDGGWKLVLDSVSPRKSVTTEVVYYANGKNPSIRSFWKNVRPAAEIVASCLDREQEVEEALYEDPEGWSAASRRMLRPLYDLGYKDSREGLVDPASGTLITGTAKWKYQPTSPPSESGRSGPVILQISLPPSDQRLELSQLCWEYDGELTVSEVRGQGDEGI
jgi:hypothetical protein